MPLKFRGSILCKYSEEKSRDFVKGIIGLEMRTGERSPPHDQADTPYSEKTMLTTHSGSPFSTRELSPGCIIPAEGK